MSFCVQNKDEDEGRCAKEMEYVEASMRANFKFILELK